MARRPGPTPRAAAGTTTTGKRATSDALVNGASLRGLSARGTPRHQEDQGLRAAVRQVLMRASSAGLQTYHGLILEDVEHLACHRFPGHLG